jgi:autotransporter-associated beta strand protein
MTGDATWLASPATSSFNDGGNWDTGVVPTDIAMFGASNTTTISIGTSTTLNAFAFAASAPSYTFNVTNGLVLQGAGFTFQGPAPTVTVNLTGANLVGDSAGASSFGGITGNGSVVKQNTGVLTLTGSNSYTGGTTVTAGTLKIASAAALPANSTVAVNGGTFYLDGNDLTIASLQGTSAGMVALGANTLTVAGGGTFAGDITGTGSLIKQAGNIGSLVTLTLTGNNTYSGGTTVLGGILSGIVQGNITNDSEVLLTTSQTYAGNMTGDATFLISGLRTTVILTGDNSGFSGLTSVGDGLTPTTLQVGNGGTTGTLGTDRIEILNQGLLVFDRVDSITVSASIGGHFGGPGGAIEQIGGGTVTLTGANNFGDADIENGTLRLGAGGSMGGGISLSSGGTFDLGAQSTASSVTGTGTVTIAGGTLSGNANGVEITGFGTVKATVFGAVLAAAGGQLEFTSTVDATTNPPSTISVGQAARTVLKFDSIVGSATLIHPTVTFLGGTSLLDLSSTTLGKFHGILAQFASGEGIKVANAASATLGGSGTVLTVYDSGHTALGTLTFSSSYTGGIFTVTNQVISVSGAPVDATWLAAPATNSFNDGANWTSGAVPVGTAFFGPSSVTTISVGSATTLGTLQFNAGAPGYTFNVTANLTLNAGGIIDSSSNVPTLNVSGATLTFASSSMGDATISTSGSGGISLTGTSTGGTSRVILGAGTSLTLSTVPVALGSIEGAGSVNLGGAPLTVGTNNLSTVASGVITGAGGLVKVGTGTMTLGGANTYSGGTTLSAGTLAVSADNGLGGGAGGLTFGGGALETTASFATARTIAINGSGTLSTDAGTTLTLTGSFAGTGTLIKAGSGTLRLGSGVMLGPNLAISAGTFDLNGNNETLPSLSGAGGTLSLGANTVTVNQSTNTTFSGNITGTGSLIKQGSGDLRIDGNNSYSGGTIVSGGTLEGNTTGLQGNIVDNATVYISQSVTGTYAGVISGTGSLVANGGTIILTGNNTYTGGTTVSGGWLQVGNGGTSGTLGSGAILMSGSGTALAFDRSDTLTLSGPVSGAGSVRQIGTGTTILTGANSYGGGTIVSAGTLQLGAGASLLSNSTVSLAGGIFDIVANNQSLTSVAGNGILMIEGGTLTTSSINLIAAMEVFGFGRVQATVDGAGSLVAGGGVLEFQSAVDTLMASTITIGAAAGTGLKFDSTVGSNTVHPTVTFQGGSTLLDLSSTTLGNFQGIIAGFASGEGIKVANAASATLDGSGKILTVYDSGHTALGTLTFSSSYSGDVFTVSNNIVSVRAPTSDAMWLAAPATSSFNSGANWSTGSVPTGTASFGASATTTVSVGSSATLGALQFNAGAPAYTFNVSANLTLNAGGIVDNSSNAPTLNVSAGTLTFASSSTGDATITTSGSAAVALTGTGTSGTSRLVLGAGAGLTVSTWSPVTVGSIEGAGSVTLAGSQLTVGSNNLSTTASGVFSGTGSLVKSGTGTTTLGGQETYIGGTTVTAGTLRLVSGGSLAATGALVVSGGTFDLNGNSQTLSSLSGASTSATVALGSGTLTVDQSGTTTFSGAITGTGSLVKQGSGTLRIDGGNSYSGGTTVSAGTLEANTSGLQGNVVNNATVHINQGYTGTYAGVMSGTGVLLADGGGVILTGNNTYTGGTTVVAGTLQVGNGGTSGAMGAGAVTDNGILSFDRSDTLTVGPIGGTGSLQQIGGTTTLSGANTYSGGTTVSAGTLLLAAGASLASGGALTLSGGTFDMGANSLTLGTLAGSSGIFMVEGGTLAALSTLSLASAMKLIGYGTVQAAVDGAGSMVAAAGTFELTSAVDATTASQIRVGLAAHGAEIRQHRGQHHGASHGDVPGRYQPARSFVDDAAQLPRHPQPVRSGRRHQDRQRSVGVARRHRQGAHRLRQRPQRAGHAQLQQLLSRRRLQRYEQHRVDLVDQRRLQPGERRRLHRPGGAVHRARAGRPGLVGWAGQRDAGFDRPAVRHPERDGLGARRPAGGRDPERHVVRRRRQRPDLRQHLAGHGQQRQPAHARRRHRQQRAVRQQRLQHLHGRRRGWRLQPDLGCGVGDGGRAGLHQQHAVVRRHPEPRERLCRPAHWPQRLCQRRQPERRHLHAGRLDLQRAQRDRLVGRRRHHRRQRHRPPAGRRRQRPALCRRRLRHVRLRRLRRQQPGVGLRHDLQLQGRHRQDRPLGAAQRRQPSADRDQRHRQRGLPRDDAGQLQPQHRPRHERLHQGPRRAARLRLRLLTRGRSSTSRVPFRASLSVARCGVTCAH